jgi:osomolarity two-component system response regulator SKN7
MNDVLAKPFTKDGMVRILKKHLPYMLKNPSPPGSATDEIAPANGQPGSAASYGASAGMAMGQMAGGPQPISTGAAQGVKFENTPIQSPATTASWHSPNQMSHTSPTLDSSSYMTAVGGGPGSMVITPGGSQQRPQYVPQQMATSSGMSHSDERPEKRQRMYGSSQGAYS